MKKSEREMLLDKVNDSYYEHTDMSSVKPDVPLQKMNVLGQRYKRHQMYGFGSEYGYGVGGNIRIPLYCDYCKHGDLSDEPEFVLEHCRMSEPKFSATHNGIYDSIGWHSECPNCRAQTWQVVDVPHPYAYEPAVAKAGRDE